jgi:1,4-dihydroxy-2-naphthoyl-CoA hydrolase
MEINANHLRAVRDGYVTGTATIIHNGRSSQVWEIRVCDEQDQLCCISRFTAALRDQA